MKVDTKWQQSAPATEESELVASKAELEIMRKQRWKQGGKPRWRTSGEVLCTKSSDESRDGLSKREDHR